MIDTYLTIVTHPFLWIFLGLTVCFFLVQRLVAAEPRGKQIITKGWLSRNYVLVVISVACFLAALALVFYLVEVGISVSTLVDHLRAAASGYDPKAENSADQADILRSLSYAVAALLGVMAAAATIFFSIIKVWINERQTIATEQGHITDRINKAVEGLGATKLTKTVYETPRYRKKEGKWIRDEDGNPVPALRPDGQHIIDREIVETSEPNLEVRLGAIYALERIAQDSTRDHVQIVEILCTYIRQNFPAKSAEKYDGSISGKFYERDKFSLSGIRLDNTDERDGDDFLLSTTSRYNQTKKIVSDFHENQLTKWARGLTPRQDLQAAITVLGKRNNKTIEREYKFTNQYNSVGFRLNLSNSCLQGVNFEALDFRDAIFDGSIIDGAKFNRAQLDGVVAYNVSLRASEFDCCKIQNAIFYDSDFTLAWAVNSVFKECLMSSSNFTGANFAGAKLIHSSMVQATFECANLYRTAFAGNEDQDGDMRVVLYGDTNLFGTTVADTLFFCVNLDDFICYTPTEETSAYCDVSTSGNTEVIKGFQRVGSEKMSFETFCAFVEKNHMSFDDSDQSEH